MGHGIQTVGDLCGWHRQASMGPCLWGTEYGDLNIGHLNLLTGFNGAVPLGHGIRRSVFPRFTQ